MIYVGIDDTDTLETPGTNKLAMHLAGLLHDEFETRWIVRHQLLEDPRVPCTYRNGCVSLLLAPRGRMDVDGLIGRLRRVIVAWCPAGSDPGLCVTRDVSREITAWGRRVQSELVTQAAAAALAHAHGVYLEPLGGTGDGIVGALAAVGLLATSDSGRVVYRRRPEAFELSGVHSVEAIRAAGVDEIVSLSGSAPIEQGTVDLGKRLRPNLRAGRVVLYVAPASDGEAPWVAERVVA
jgi:hypothetical protein